MRHKIWTKLETRVKDLLLRDMRYPANFVRTNTHVAYHLHTVTTNTFQKLKKNELQLNYLNYHCYDMIKIV